MIRTQRALFLAELRVSGNVTFACMAAGVTRAGALAERIIDPSFERSWRICMDDARAFAMSRTIQNRADFRA